MVSRRTSGIGGRHAPLRNASNSGSDRGRIERRNIALSVEATGWSIARSPQPPAPAQAGPPQHTTVVMRGMGAALPMIASRLNRHGRIISCGSPSPYSHVRSPRAIVTGGRDAPPLPARLGKPGATAAGA